jgi:hypothetical protein
MKHLLLIFIAIIVLSCKKDTVDPIQTKGTPIVTGELKVIYRSEDPTGMTVWCNTTNEFFFNEHKAASEYIFTKTITNGQRLDCSVTSPSGYWKTLIIIFNSDTLYNVKNHTNMSYNKAI